MERKSVLFDIGNTIIASSEIKVRSLFETSVHLEQIGLIQDAEELRQVYLRIDLTYHELHMNHLYSDHRIVRRVGAALGVSSLHRFEGEFLGTYRKHVRANLVPDNTITLLFSDLSKAGYQIGILSDGSTDEQIESLWRLDILRFVDVCIVSEDVGVEKPDQKMFELAIAQLKSHAHDILMVGDVVERDIVGGNVAGMQTALILQYSSASHSELATYSLDELEDLRSVLL